MPPLTQPMMLRVVFCFAHMVLFCVYNVFLGWRVMSSRKGGGVVDENGGMVGRGKVPAYSEYTAVYSRVYSRILRSMQQEYFSNTWSILTNTLECVDCHTQVWVYGTGFVFFDPLPPLFSGC